jgi:hypothetical protein
MFPLTSSPLLGLFHDSRRAETAWGQPCVQLRSCTGPLMFSIDGGWEDQAHTSRRLRGLKLNLRRSGWVRGAVPRATILLRIFRLCQTYKIHVNPCKSNVFSGVSPWIFNFGVYCISGHTPFHCRKIAWNWAEEFFVKDTLVTDCLGSVPHHSIRWPTWLISHPLSDPIDHFVECWTYLKIILELHKKGCSRIYLTLWLTFQCFFPFGDL